jgi:SnoaL-like polyketide cyclase
VSLTVEDMIAEGDKVVDRLTWQATHQGPFMGILPTGNRLGSAPWNRGQAASSASSSHFGFRPRHLGTSAGGTANVNNSSIDQR